eukprot:gene4402-4307_t
MLIGGFLAVAAVGAVIGINGIQKSSQINDLAQLMYEREINGMLHATEANINLVVAGRAMRSALLAVSEQERATQLRAAGESVSQAQSELERSAQYFVTDSGKALARDAGAALREYAAGLDQVAALLKEEELANVRASTDKMRAVRTLADKADDLLGKLVERKRSDAKALNDETDTIYSRIRVLLISLTAGGALVGLAIGVALTRSLTRALGGEPAAVAQAANAIAAGDLSLPIDTSRARAGSVRPAPTTGHAAPGAPQRRALALPRVAQKAAPGADASWMRIPVDQALPGMFVHALDASWMDHPFWRSRFALQGEGDVQALRSSGVAHCWIDISRGADVAAGAAPVRKGGAHALAELPAAPSTVASSRRPCTPAPGDSAASLHHAERLALKAREVVRALFCQARAGQAISLDHSLAIVDELTAMVATQPGALIGLVRLKSKDNYTFAHSVAVCTLMIALARQLGLAPDQADSPWWWSTTPGH